MPSLSHLVLALLAGVLGCASQQTIAIHPLYDGHEETWLTCEVAKLATAQHLLENLREDKTDAAIEALELELDHAILSLEELARLGQTAGVSQERRQNIYCHLRSVRDYREAYPSNSQYPNVGVLAREALSRVPDQEQCPRRPTSR